MNFASKRLMRDFKELKKDAKQLNLCASPLEDNLFEWHANICPESGRYQGIIIHCILKFPQTYPSEPPEVQIMTGIPHSNIIKHNGNNYFLCLDMLNNFFWEEGGNNEKYSGWSSSYTVKILMMQLQTFLFDDYIENYDGIIKHTLYQLSPEEGGGNRNKKTIEKSIQKAFHDSKNFKCKCGHCWESPNPKLLKKIPERKNIIIRRDIIDSYGNIDNQILNLLVNLNEKNNNQIYEKLFNYSWDSNISYIPDCNCKNCKKYIEDLKKNQCIPIKDDSEKNDIKQEITNLVLKLNENYIWNIINKYNYDDNLQLTQLTNLELKYNRLLNYKGKIDLRELKNPIFLKIFTYLDYEDIFKIASLCPEYAILCDDPVITIKREFICFYTKESFEDTILGYGINVNFYKGSDTIKNITPVLDLLSFESFNTNEIRHSVWNDEFRFWLPINISLKHISKGRKIIEQNIADIYFSRYNSDIEYKSKIMIENNFKPKFFVDIICKLMSSMIVDMLKEDIFISNKALNGFCEFHHLLIQFIKWYPEIIDIANNKIYNFINDSGYTRKNKIPSLGDFLVLLLVTNKYTWNDIKSNYKIESLDRSVRWILHDIPNIGSITDINIVQDLFNTLKIGKRLFLFSLYFINYIAPKCINDYDKRYGRPSKIIQDEFQNKIKEINNINNWNDYYKELKIYKPPDSKILRDYKIAIKRSAEKRYHKNRIINHESKEIIDEFKIR
jgi:ubiquitin-protein ligase